MKLLVGKIDGHTVATFVGATGPVVRSLMQEQAGPGCIFEEHEIRIAPSSVHATQEDRDEFRRIVGDEYAEKVFRALV